ncbi:MAG TPA: LLM class flavin-dependent oxidoreductase [Acidimicrobiales bacterium]|nr:LLM class flavin-dependent oxidoreductase [Acidimicrobiales bacterium]
MGLNIQNVDNARTDLAVYTEELQLASLAEPLGFESIWAVEHHFTDYVLIPDPTFLLSYLAGKTSKVELGSMVIVLPWHDPVRVVEHVAMVDNLSDGRMVLGIGRGLGRVEFEGFGVPMSESRERFVEAGEMVVRALEDGFIEGKGKYYPRERRDIRPAPTRTFRDRTYAAAVSPESAVIMADLGVGLLYVPQKPWDHVAKDLTTYAARYREVHSDLPIAPIVSSYVFCDRNEDRATSLAREYVGTYYNSLIRHYEMADTLFTNLKGYEFYEKMSDTIRNGEEAATDFFLDLQVFGTPEQCYEKALKIHSLMNNDRFVGVFSFGKMPYDEALRNIHLFAREVMPELQTFDGTSELWRSTI